MTEATGLEGFDLFAAARGGGDVTRGVPSLADVAAADEVCNASGQLSCCLLSGLVCRYLDSKCHAAIGNCIVD